MTIRRDLIPVEGGNLPLTIARASRHGAAVVIMPSAFGVAPDLEAQMEELAVVASVVVAIDPFFRGDSGIVPYDDMGRVVARLQALEPGRPYRDFRAAVDWVRSQEGVRAVVAVGICFGAGAALLAAADGVVDGVVTWHGSRMESYVERAGEMRCPMRLHYGAADPFVTSASLEALRAAFAGRADVRLVVHEGATHGFSHRSAPQAYDARAEQAGMESVRELSAGAAPLARR